MIARAEETTPNELWENMKSSTKEATFEHCSRKRKRRGKWATVSTPKAVKKRREPPESRLSQRESLQERSEYIS